MVFRTKRRKGRSATTAASKRPGREPDQAAEATTKPSKEIAKHVEETAKRSKEAGAARFAKPKRTKPSIRTSTNLNDEEIELSITTSPRSVGQSDISSPREVDEGFETILESRSPSTTVRRLSSPHSEAREPILESSSPNNEKREIAKTTPSNGQPRRGFFRVSAHPSRRNSSSQTPRGRKREKGLTIMEPLEPAPSFQSSPSFQWEGKKPPMQAQKKPSVSSSKGRPPLGRPVSPGRKTQPTLQEKRSMPTNGDETTGLKIVVFDNENKTERRVRVTLLDTNKTVNLQGEKIEPFLSVILREAVKTNQNIHIENGNMDDSNSLRSTGLARAVSFLKQVGSDTASSKKDASSSEEPRLPNSSSEATKEAEKQLVPDMYIKRVCSVGNEDDDSLLQEITSIIGRGKVGLTEKGEQKPGKGKTESGGGRDNKGVEENPDLKTTQSERAPGPAKTLESPALPKSPPMASKSNPPPEKETNRRLKHHRQQEGSKTKSDSNRATSVSDESNKVSTTPRRRQLTWAETLGISPPGTPSDNQEEASDEISLDSLHFMPGNLIRAYESFPTSFRSPRSAKGQIESKVANTDSEIQESSAQVGHESSASKVVQNPKSKEAEVEAGGAGTGDNDEGRLTGSSVQEKATKDKSQDGNIEKDSVDIVREAATTHSECVPGDDTGALRNKAPACISSSEPGNESTVPTQSQKHQIIQRTQVSEDDVIVAIRTGMILAKQLGLLHGADGQKTANAVLELAKQIVGGCDIDLQRAALEFQSLPALEASSVQEEKQSLSYLNPPSGSKPAKAQKEKFPKKKVLPVVETVKSVSSEEGTVHGKDVAFEGEPSGTNCRLARQTPNEVDVNRVRNSFFRLFRKNKEAQLRVLPMERAKKAVESAVEKAVQTAVKTALVDDISFENDESTLFTNSRSLQAESHEDLSSSSGSDSNSFSSSFLGSSDIPEDDSYLNGYSSGQDDSTLGTAATLDDLMTWAQEHNDDPDNVVSFGDGRRGTRMVSVVSEGRLGEIEIEANDGDGEIEIEPIDEQRSVQSIKGALSVMSEENGYNQYEEQTTPLMEAFVFYIENTLETMNKVKKAKKRATVRGNKKVDGNLTIVSEGLLQSFVKILGKEDGKNTGESTGGGGRGLASTEPVKAADEKPLNETEDWGDIAQTVSDDMVRGAFGLITSALSEERMTGFTPKEAQAVRRTGR